MTTLSIAMNFKIRTYVLTGLIALVTLAIPHESWGQLEKERATLKGITAIYVIVGDLSQELKESGLSEGDLQTDVERRLRYAGIRLATKSGSSGFLYVRVMVLPVTGTVSGETFGYAAWAWVAFYQDVQLKRDSSIGASVATWSLEKLIIDPSTEAIRRVVRDLTDKFAHDYLAVNPK